MSSSCFLRSSTIRRLATSLAIVLLLAGGSPLAQAQTPEELVGQLADPETARLAATNLYLNWGDFQSITFGPRSSPISRDKLEQRTVTSREIAYWIVAHMHQQSEALRRCWAGLASSWGADLCAMMVASGVNSARSGVVRCAQGAEATLQDPVCQDLRSLAASGR